MSLHAATLPVQIRPMQAADLDQVQFIDRLSFSIPWPSSAYQYELFENDLSLLWVAELSPPGSPKLVVGVIVVWLILDEVHIATLSVHPDYREHGIGLALVATALAAAIRKGMVTATLEVRAGNLAAQQLYKHFHFEITGRRFRYYRDNNEDALIMTINRLDSAYLEWLEGEAWKVAPPESRAPGDQD
jgi:ribosomal-protein-alanine N-acetyltransferase